MGLEIVLHEERKRDRVGEEGGGGSRLSAKAWGMKVVFILRV